MHTTSVLGDLKKYPELKQKYKQMTKRLEKKPHLYSSFEREDTTKQQVARWLTPTSGYGEPDLVGFSSLCPIEPQRSVPAPCACNSGINICSKKRKRCDDDDEHDADNFTLKSSSDTRLFRCDDVKSRLIRKRIRI